MKLPLVLFASSSLGGLLAVGEVPGGLIAPLVGQGIAGCVLAWFMFRNEVRQKAVETSLDDLSKAHCLLMVRLDPDNTALREETERVVKRIDAKREKRG